MKRRRVRSAALFIIYEARRPGLINTGMLLGCLKINRRELYGAARLVPLCKSVSAPDAE